MGIAVTDDDILAKLRDICLSLPEATEGEGVGAPTFRVRDKIFAMRHPAEGRPSLWFKAQRGVQETLVADDPQRYFVPPYVGHHGWVGTWLDIEVEWEWLRDWIEQSYSLTAPKKLIARMTKQQNQQQTHP